MIFQGWSVPFHVSHISAPPPSLAFSFFFAMPGINTLDPCYQGARSRVHSSGQRVRLPTIPDYRSGAKCAPLDKIPGGGGDDNVAMYAASICTGDICGGRKKGRKQ
jgi:hypothetical protein